MRQTGPVTQREYTFPAHVTLVSVTDPKGRITYCNDAFVSVSGYTRDELLGQAHNMVRHPDMPEEAFRDMWDTIEKGLPWTGMVKNRRKDGDHYWVEANVTPLRAGNRTVGFVSVRTSPKREQVQGAESLYARMREEHRAGRVQTVLASGMVTKNHWASRLFGAARRWGHRIGAVGLTAGIGAALTGVAAQWGLLFFVPVALVTLVATAWAKNLSVDQQLQRVTSQALQVAAGDLCVDPLEVSDGAWMNLERALNQVAVNLRTVVLDCRNEVEELRIHVSEIAAGNQDLSSRTESQASSLEQTAATMDEINGTVQQSAGAARQGASMATEAAGLADQTRASVRDAALAMTQIEAASNRIAEFIHVIEGVAFQTNILALNAAVEAARAGESGRGFAVVASEVRALAQRTTEAAKEVRKLITDASERVQAGNMHTQTAQGRMESAVSSVQRVSQVLAEISHGTDEQQTGIAQVNEAIGHIDTLTQQNAAMVEELASTAMTLTDRVASVADSMSLFRLTPKDRSIAERDAVTLRKQAR
ncbi:MAG: methyl-accepting chemotaxis protein [Inhella sp.]|jgi:aerotaxis receptor|uniref:methyl-accepting chemotaxis protein n=1 Tax=Inhella sp. TaxID=1921806 RepID=UPI0022BC81AB|nr:PAS domain-containing methyl-accepting chemotaxis protein [Inhella sp.]MCZ8236431.1 methyl-accepting chemotaxis protein [Inhella sp.]